MTELPVEIDMVGAGADSAKERVMQDVVHGEFVDFKIVRTRSAVQLVIEIPIENADSAIKCLGGIPQPGDSVWVGIAPLRSADEEER